MKKLIFVLAVCMALGIAGFGSAGTQKGDKTGTISASVQFPTEGDAVYMGIGALGFFSSDALQWEFAGLVISTQGETAGYLQVRPNLHFSTQGKVVPYIGLTVGALVGGDDAIFLYGGQVGLKNFISEKIYLQLEGNYLTANEGENGTFSIILGLGTKF